MSDIVHAFRSLGGRRRRRPKWHFMLALALFVLPLLAYTFVAGVKVGSFFGDVFELLLSGSR